MKLAFIGAGRVVKWQIDTFKYEPSIDVCGCYEIDASVRESYRMQDISFFSDIDSLLLSDPDVICISTPSDSHFTVLKDVVHKIKPSTIITVEKPTFMKLSDFKEVINIAKSLNIVVLPIFQNRYNKAVQCTKKIVDDGRLGQILHGRVTLSWCRPQRYFDQAAWRGKWASDGGSLTNQGIHFIDLTRYLFGEISDLIFRMDRIDVDIECENVACGILRTSEGRLISLDISTVSRPEDHKVEMTIYGSKGFISLGGIAANCITESSLEMDLERSSEQIPHAYGYGHLKFYRELMKSIDSGSFNNILSSIEDSLKTHQLLHAAYTSAYYDGANIKPNDLQINLLGEHKGKINFLSRSV